MLSIESDMNLSKVCAGLTVYYTVERLLVVTSDIVEIIKILLLKAELTDGSLWKLDINKQFFILYDVSVKLERNAVSESENTFGLWLLEAN